MVGYEDIVRYSALCGVREGYTIGLDVFSIFMFMRSVRNKLRRNGCSKGNAVALIDNQNLESILSNIIAWIANCDSKASAVIGWFGVAVSIFGLTGCATDFLEMISLLISIDNMWVEIYLFCMSICMAILCNGFIFIVFVLLAKLSLKKFRRLGLKDDSMIYFTMIAKYEKIDDYIDKMKIFSCDDYRKDLVQQIYVCAYICNQKSYNYKFGMENIVYGGISFGIMVIGAKFIVNYYFIVC